MTIAAYRDRESGAYPISLPEVRRRSGVAFGAEPSQDVLDAAGVDPVHATVQPEYDPAVQVLSAGEPQQINGEWRQTWMVEIIPISPEMVDVERDGRMVSGFDFMGVRFQSRPQDRENIMGAFALASAALTIGGKEPGDLRWHGGSEDFVFIAEDNSRVPMDAVAVLGLGQAAAAQKSSLTFAANDLKKLNPIPADFASDQYWP